MSVCLLIMGLSVSVLAEESVRPVRSDEETSPDTDFSIEDASVEAVSGIDENNLKFNDENDGSQNETDEGSLDGSGPFE